jgi:flagellar hook protein FlgE
MSFSIGLSGLQAAAKDLEVTGNNVANSGTTGFKKSRAEFSDIYASSFGSCVNQAAVGVRLADVSQQFSQGNIELTENSLDLAINGEGFFILSSDAVADGKVYTRDGSFQVDRDGYVVTSSGQRLQGYPPTTPNSATSTFDTGKLADIQLPLDNMAPKATTGVDLQVNLNADEVAKIPADPADPTAPSDPDFVFATGTATADPDPDSYNWSTTYQVYDSLGKPRDVTMYFRKTGPDAWSVYAGMRDANGVMRDVGSSANAYTFTTAGEYLSGGPIDIDTTPLDDATTAGIFPDNGAATLKFPIDITESTQYHNSRSNLNDISQDGYTTGTLSGFEVDADGIIFSRYSNGQSYALAQVAMTNFKNPQGLQQLGDNDWGETYASGEPINGVAGDGRLGSIQSCALENSNVDLTEELVNMITAQRNYEANAKTISTADQMTQTILNIR